MTNNLEELRSAVSFWQALLDEALKNSNDTIDTLIDQAIKEEALDKTTMDATIEERFEAIYTNFTITIQIIFTDYINKAPLKVVYLINDHKAYNVKERTASPSLSFGAVAFCKIAVDSFFKGIDISLPMITNSNNCLSNSETIHYPISLSESKIIGRLRSENIELTDLIHESIKYGLKNGNDENSLQVMETKFSEIIDNRVCNKELQLAGIKHASTNIFRNYFEYYINAEKNLSNTT